MMKRNLNSEHHRKYFGEKQCWICGNKLEGRRRHYCSAKCYGEMGKLVDSTTWSIIREKALERDNKKCVVCGDGYESVKKEQESIEKTLGSLDKIILKKLKEGLNYHEIPEEKERVKLYARLNFLETHFLVIDHKLPIAMGGDAFDLDNLQTLCHKHNKRKTFLDMKTLAYYRRCKTEEQRQELREAHLRTLKRVGLA